MAESTAAVSHRIIKSGLLTKRCRWSWRPRFVELISNPPDMSGPQPTYLLHIYDQSRQTIKDRILVEDIVTLRSGKNVSFHIYLNSGKFLLFKAESLDSQSSWMAEIKMALGKGNMFHVQVTGSLMNNFALDHALLYCIGVNLPKHSVGQLDRVLVLASPVNDVNLYAWSLDRVKRFMTIEAGIQMELCSSCMGKHHKKVITFLLSPDFREDCMAFLLRELRIIDEPQQFMDHGPFVYNVPHRCGSPTSQNSRVYANTFPGAPGAPPPYCNDAELAVFQNQKLGRDTVTLHPRAYSNVSTRTNYSMESEGSVSINTPPLPPRDIARPNYEHHQSFVTTDLQPQPYLKWKTKVRKTRTNDDDHAQFETPYHISHRIYIGDNGSIRKESQVFGSGSGEFRKRRHVYPPTVPPRNITDNYSNNPIYIPNDELLPGPQQGSPKAPPRPDFIGRRPPVLPPRGVLDPTLCTKDQFGRSMSDSVDEPDPLNLPRPRYWSEPTILECNNPEEQPPTDSSYNRPPLPPRKNLSFDSHYMNVESGRSTPSLCTDDVTNADFELMTKVTFTNIIPPSYLPPRSNRQPVPVPRTRSKKEASWTLSYTPTPPSRSPPSPPPPFRSPPPRSPPPLPRSPSPTHIQPITKPPHCSFNVVDDKPLMSIDSTPLIPQPLAEPLPTQHPVVAEANKSREQSDHFEWTMNTSHSKSNSPLSFQRNIERFRSHSSGSLSSGSDDYAKYKHRSNEC